MREQVVKLLHARPFQPFVVDVAEDVAFAIPTPDHVFPFRSVLAIEDDNGALDLVPYAQIRRIHQERTAA